MSRTVLPSAEIEEQIDRLLAVSMRDVESLCEQAGLGKLSKSTASRVCQELRERLPRSGAAICTTSTSQRCSWTRSFSLFAPTGPREGVLVAWGFTENGERVLL